MDPSHLPATPTTGTPGSAPGPAPAAEGGLSLPFDPVRLLAALLRNWVWLLLAGVVLGAGLLTLGHYKLETSYTVETELIRREATTTIRASLQGDSFKPRQVTVQTIVTVMQSPKLLDRVGSLATPPISGSAFARMLTIKPEKETDLISVSLKTKLGPQATADLVNLYAHEVVAMTAQMQSDEAAELDKFLREQIAKIDAELDDINKESLEFSRESDFYGDDREVEAYLRQSSDAEMQIENAKTELETVEFRMASVEHELAQQDPMAIRLNQARAQLKTLKASYSENSPLVKSAADQVAALEQQVEASGGLKTNFDANFQFSDNTLANDLYMQLVNLRGQREGLQKQMAQLKTFAEGVQEKLRSVPAKSQHHAGIVARQQSLQVTRDLFSGRQHEAQIYEENSPGLYRQFAPATEDSVEVSNRTMKVVLAGVVGFVLGLVLATGAVLGRELLDLRVVSAGDLKRSTGVPVIARLPDLAGFTPVQLAQWRFRTWAQTIRKLSLQNETRLTLAFTSTQPGEGKSTFIRELHVAALDRRLPVVLVTNAPVGGSGSRRVPLIEALARPELVCEHVRATPEVALELDFDHDWKWTLENRTLWERAWAVWQSLNSLAVFVELPPMTDLDAVLAAELMPLTIWVTTSGRLQQRELAEALELVEAGEVNLVAAMLDYEQPELVRLSFLGRLGLPV
jgi:capsular polysaccharide biosynthesis protein